MANKGTAHFKAQRATAYGMVVLVAWTVVSLIGHTTDTHAEFMSWISSPLVAIPFALLILVGFYHMSLGVDEVIDDYIHKASSNRLLHMANKIFAALLGGISLWSIIAITLIK